MKTVTLASLVGLLLGGSPRTTALDENPFQAKITVDAAKPIGDMEPIWRFFGADEPNYATMKDGRKLPGQIEAFQRDRISIIFATPSIPFGS